MKHIFYYLPAVLPFLLFVAITLFGGFHMIDPAALLCTLLLFFGAYLLTKGRAFGCLPGIIIGAWLIHSGLQSRVQIFPQEYVGIAYLIYQIGCGITVYQHRKK